jgi:alkylation response protein AidB-like acyl-CoA dehydrogenase
MQSQTSQAVAAARALRPVILENRQTTEAGRQVAQPIIDALKQARLGRMALPTEYGGLAVSPVEGLEILETLAEAEASVAWIVWNSSLPCWLGRFLDQDARDEVFGDPDALYACSTRPQGRAVRSGDSYAVNGQWSLVSGCSHASWIPVMCLVEEGGEVQMLAPNVPHMRMLYIPKDAHEILDTWHVGGLRGTGSHDSALKNVSVPVSRSFAMGEPSRVDSPLGRMPIFCTMSAGCASICLGVASSTLQALLDLATNKGAVDGGPGLRDRAPLQSLVGRVAALLESARRSLRHATDAVWNDAVAGQPVQPTDIAAMLGAAVTAAQTCRQLVTEMYAAAGASSLYTSSPIERAHRDIHAVTQHIALQPHWLEQSGRVQLGMEPTHPLFAF